jgi:caspase domain-containing protein
MKSSRRYAPALVVCVLGLLLATPALAQEEASRVRVLLVLDTYDRMGATWGLDGENMKALLEHAFRKQGLSADQHYTLDIFTGSQVTVKSVLDYYRNLDSGPNETFLFYYSGHGGYHAKKGHFMALTPGRQQLYRNDIFDAMDGHNPRLKVVLTDCCANLTGGAWRDTEPTEVMVRPSGVLGKPGLPRAARQEPPARVDSRRDFKVVPTTEPPRPQITVRKLPPARLEEPPSEVRPLSTNFASNQKRAILAEPDGSVTKYVVLRTPKGGVPLHELLAKVDGQMLRQLLFQHRGVVDINGCPKGLTSQGTLEWGGSLFTLAFLHLQAEDPSKLDANGDGFIEWREILPPWVQLTQAINRAVSRDGYTQTPEAWQLKAAK